MTNDQDKKQKPNKNDELHIHYGGMTIGSLLKKLEADKSLDGVREEILAKIKADKLKRDLKEQQEKNNDEK